MSTFAKTPRFQTSSGTFTPIPKTPRCQSRFGPKSAGCNSPSDRNLRNKVDKGDREISVDNPLISAMKRNQIDGVGIVQLEARDLRDDKANKDYSAWIKEPKDGCRENKENSLFAAKDVVKGTGGTGEEVINQILQERLSLLEGLLENVRKEIDVRRCAQ